MNEFLYQFKIWRKERNFWWCRRTEKHAWSYDCWVLDRKSIVLKKIALSSFVYWVFKIDGIMLLIDKFQMIMTILHQFQTILSIFVFEFDWGSFLCFQFQIISSASKWIDILEHILFGIVLRRFELKQFWRGFISTETKLLSRFTVFSSNLCTRNCNFNFSAHRCKKWSNKDLNILPDCFQEWKKNFVSHSRWLNIVKKGWWGIMPKIT